MFETQVDPLVNTRESAHHRIDENGHYVFRPPYDRTRVCLTWPRKDGPSEVDTFGCEVLYFWENENFSITNLSCIKVYSNGVVTLNAKLIEDRSPFEKTVTGQPKSVLQKKANRHE